MIWIPKLELVCHRNLPASASLLLIAIAHTTLSPTANAKHKGWSAERLAYLAELVGIEYACAVRNMRMLIREGYVEQRRNPRDPYKPWRRVVALVPPEERKPAPKVSAPKAPKAEPDYAADLESLASEVV